MTMAKVQHHRSPRAPRRERLEMADHRVFFSDDNWKTIWQERGYRNGRSHRLIIDKDEADRIRLIVVAQSSAGRY
jgi:hypothetical protein